MFEAFSLKGLLRSVSSILESEDADIEDDDAEHVDESLLPDLSLDNLEEDATDNLDGARGPYQSEVGARDDAEAACGGDFIIIPSRDGYYWKYKEADTSSAHGPYQSEVGARQDAESATGSLDFMIYRRPDGYYWNSNNQDVTEEFHLGEDSESVEGNPSMERERGNGPFRTEYDAVQDGQAQTNGVEGDNFTVTCKGNQFYWTRNVQEELDNEPDLHQYDNDGIENSRHAYEPKRPGTALGDNPLGEACDDEDGDESVEDIYESLQRQYNKFVGK